MVSVHAHFENSIDLSAENLVQVFSARDLEHFQLFRKLIDFFGRKKAEEPTTSLQEPSIVKMPRRLYAIGDIHGHRIPLEVLLDHLIDKCDLNDEDVLVCLGDYVDRGPDTRGVIERLIAHRKSFPRTVYIMGNHDHAMLLFLQGKSSGETFFLDGGFDTIGSYAQSLGTDRTQILQVIPEEHIRFLEELVYLYQMGQYVFTHAGLHPDYSIHDQRPIHLISESADYYKKPHPSGAISVRGHVRYPDVRIDKKARTIFVDTGCGFGEKLSCVELIEQKIFQVAQNSTTVDIRNF